MSDAMTNRCYDGFWSGYKGYIINLLAEQVLKKTVLDTLTDTLEYKKLVESQILYNYERISM